MNGFEAYQMYLSIKMHFENKSYDCIKYNFKVKANADTFERRPDRYQFQKLSKEKYLQEFLISNFADRNIKWVGDLLGEEADKVFTDWQRRNQSLTYMVTQELSLLEEDFMSFFKSKQGQHPPLLKMYKQNQISLETLCILNDLCGFFPIWDKKITDPVIWPVIRDRCLKYSRFLQYDKVKTKKLIKSMMAAEN